ncbi:butanediol dehydrogenase [Pullulanibacillus camelliae]|uniref:Butanediol dehydrogenase n=1 Tax=Pullulanibacillus camelliae TaxID=1707096 RepID=A0A8J2YDU9_9BACL|nr:zinc-binding dehydrogenase [Pullulanibacillus camelliae]GGE27220.1 butanediol dehydrogenase [Pullulanibacillus camelliae]
MKTLVTHSDGQLEVREIPIPSFHSKQALVKTISCGICGTDSTLIHSRFKGFPKEDYPLMLGHEGVGRVVEIGAEVKSFKVGDVVLLPFNDADEELYGALGSAWGAFSEYGVINDKACYEEEQIPEVAYAQQIVPKDIDPVDAAMLVTLREVLSNINYFGIKEKDSVVVFGSGPVALTFIKLMKLKGINQIIGVARSEEKKRVLLASGAKTVFNSREVNYAEEIHRLFPKGVNYVLDAVGSTDIINEALELICDRGEILCYGVPKNNQMQLDWSKGPYNWKINFQQMPSKLEEGEAYAQILEWIRAGRLVLKDFISDYYKFDHILEAFQTVARHDVLKKAIITY